ncbi:MAG: tyrosine phenol-lyase [Bacteroidetes bacterium GWF2_49_14]|nr:MAG: tyrosine phenol-lyase [Bacteroidetes bacterium GWF2_49_14]HBB90865.1 tyrosine phenol-lyase [Bacteroidales bacterium]
MSTTSAILPPCEPYKIKMIESLHRSTREERDRWIREARYNIFNLRSDQVFIDLLTDSGTGAMSDRQWGAIMTGDESYAGSRSFFELKETINDLLGYEHVLPTHQGRAAENVLFSVLVKEGQTVPGNAHFDTTKGHIEFRKAEAIDCTVAAAYDTTVSHPFKGNVDLNKLEAYMREASESVSFILITATCNTAGGQPVSMENIREVRKIADRYNKLLVIDAARFAENAWFIRNREKEFRNHTIRQIVGEMFSYFDAATMSSKKDGIVNIGGFIAMKDKELYRQASLFNIMFEGFLTYGGQAGRDMAALAVGLREATELEYLDSRIGQVNYLGEKLKTYGVPVQEPFGGHAVFIDALRFLPQIPREEYPGQTLVVEIYKEAGIRCAEIGTLMADRDPHTRENRYTALELVRLAIPRRTYTSDHMDYVAAALGNVFQRVSEIRKGYRLTWEAPIMRHFTMELEAISE